MRYGKRIWRGAAAFCAAAAAMTGGAGAQTSNGALAAAPIMQRVSAADVAEMMVELGVQTQLLRLEGTGQPVLVASTPGGGRFLFHFFGCADPAAASGCASTVVSTAFPAAGIPYDALNAFNGEAQVTVAVYADEAQAVVLGRNILVAGGHAKSLFKATVFLFLTDVAKFAEAAQGSVSVSFAEPAERSAKISQRIDSPAASKPFGFDSLAPLVSAAIDNAGGADFAIADPR